MTCPFLGVLRSLYLLMWDRVQHAEKRRLQHSVLGKVLMAPNAVAVGLEKDLERYTAEGQRWLSSLRGRILVFFPSFNFSVWFEFSASMSYLCGEMGAVFYFGKIKPIF